VGWGLRIHKTQKYNMKKTKEQEFVDQFMKLVKKYDVTAMSTEPFCYGKNMAVSLCVGDKTVLDYHIIDQTWVEYS
jgi:hypothetical protein